MQQYDVIILGGGAAGLSAGLYTTRAMLKTLILEKLGYGGQILVTDVIDNYPGFPEGIKGPDLGILMEKQTKRFGAEMKFEEITGVSRLDAKLKQVHTTEGTYHAKTIIIAAGGSHRKLGVPGEEEFSGKGVSYCAVCDGNFFKGQDVVVVGGGDAALDEGLYLSGLVKQVTVVHRRDELRASKILQERALKNPKFKFLWSHVVEEIKGNGQMDRVQVKDLKSGKSYEYPATGAFIYIGFVSNTEFLKGQVSLDETGHVKTDINMSTGIPGVFAAGDIRSQSFRQLGNAVGDGIAAALSAYKYITEAH
ncbi:MAG: thioredoxin-disulfide reductase [SAR202 cluster bacterium]|nr:thioredoxin-disulfide reductase [SAR202 cluster bacterium]